MVGGIVKRTIESAAGDATVDPLGGNDVATNIVSGAGGAAIGHGCRNACGKSNPRAGYRAKDHDPDAISGEAGCVRLRASTHRRLSRSRVLPLEPAAGTAVSDLLNSAISTGWNSLDWLIYSSQPPPPPPPPNFNTSGLIGCWDMQGNSCD